MNLSTLTSSIAICWYRDNYLRTFKKLEMNNELAEQIKTIAEYDGWEIIGHPEFVVPYKCFRKYLNGFMKYIPYISPQGVEYSDWSKELRYNKSYDWLMPVAKKVCNELAMKPYDVLAGIEHTKRLGVINKVKNSFFSDISELFTNVYYAIILLNKYKR